MLLPQALTSKHRQVFGPRPPRISSLTPPSLSISLTRLIPLTSVILFALDSQSYSYASAQQDAFLEKIGRSGNSSQSGVITREGETLKLNEGRWKVAMAEPVLQGAIIKGETRLLVLPPSGDEDDEEAGRTATSTQDHSRRTSQSSGEDDSQDEDFEIDESFLANSVLTPHHNNRFGQTPLTSPLSNSSRQKQFFPLGELSATTSTSSRHSQLTPIPLSHAVSSQLLAPSPEQDEDDVPRAFLTTIDLGRIGLFSGDWAVLRKNDGEEGGRLVRVFAADGLIDSHEIVALGLVLKHL